MSTETNSCDMRLFTYPPYSDIIASWRKAAELFDYDDYTNTTFGNRSDEPFNAVRHDPTLIP